jgi:hypothetical protein
MRAEEILPGSTERISDPIKDSNPLRNRDRHRFDQFGTLIAIPRNPLALIPRVTQNNAAASKGVKEDLSTDSPVNFQMARDPTRAPRVW